MDGKSERTINFAKSLSLTESENRIISRTIGDRNESLCTVVIQLYENDVRQNSWELQLSGVLCLIKDHNKRSYFFRLYFLENREMIWQHEIFSHLHLKFEQDYFISFEVENSVFGLNFGNTDEASLFYTETNKIVKKIAKKCQPAEPVPMIYPKFNINGNKVEFEYENLKKNKKDKKKKISAGDIGTPTDFTHVSSASDHGEKMGRQTSPTPVNLPVSKIQQRPLPPTPKNSTSSVSARRMPEIPNINVNLEHQNSFSSDIYETVESPDYLPPCPIFTQPDTDKPPVHRKPPKPNHIDSDDDIPDYLPMDKITMGIKKPIPPLTPKVTPAKTKSASNKPLPQIPQEMMKAPKKLPPLPVNSNVPDAPIVSGTAKKPIPQPISNKNAPYKGIVEPPSFEKKLPIPPANRFERSPSRGTRQFDTNKDEPTSSLPNTGNIADELKNFQFKNRINTADTEVAGRKPPPPAKKPLVSQPVNLFKQRMNCFENAGANGQSALPKVQNVRPSGISRENSVPKSSSSGDFLAQIKQGVKLRKVDSTNPITPVQSKENPMANSLRKALDARKSVFRTDSTCDDSDSDSEEQEWSD